MADMMTFPETVEEFMEQYKITDTEQIYSNGMEFVPILRMKQWFAHKPEPENGEWLEKEIIHMDDEVGIVIEEWQSARCSVCGKYHTTPYMYYFADYPFCPMCGAEMRGEKDE